MASTKLGASSVDGLVPWLCKAILVWVVVGLFSQQLTHAYGLGDGLTDSGDAYSEAGNVRAGEGYAALGITSNAGLPDVAYGNQFEREGGKHDPLLCDSPARCVYLHYPPGPDLAVGVMTILFGKGRLFVYRLLPLAVGLAALAALGVALLRALGPVRAAVVMWLLGGIPMVSNMMHVFTLHGYALAFFLAEMAVLLIVYSRPARRYDVSWLAAVTFLEGWVAFEYVFLLTLAPIAVFLAFGDPRDRDQRRRAGYLVLAAGAGFGLALVLHFLQVAIHLGGVGQALADFAASAKKRTSGPTWVVPPIPGPVGLLLYYGSRLLPDKKFYDGNFLAYVATVVVLLWPKRASLSLGRFGRVHWVSTRAELASFLVMLALGCGWIVTMQQHASIHGHFLPRLFVAVILWGYLAVSRTVSLERVAAVAVAGSSAPIDASPAGAERDPVEAPSAAKAARHLDSAAAPLAAD